MVRDKGRCMEDLIAVGDTRLGHDTMCALVSREQLSLTALHGLRLLAGCLLCQVREQGHLLLG